MATRSEMLDYVSYSFEELVTIILELKDSKSGLENQVYELKEYVVELGGDT